MQGTQGTLAGLLPIEDNWKKDASDCNKHSLSDWGHWLPFDVAYSVAMAAPPFSSGNQSLLAEVECIDAGEPDSRL